MWLATIPLTLVCSHAVRVRPLLQVVLVLKAVNQVVPAANGSRGVRVQMRVSLESNLTLNVNVNDVMNGSRLEY